MGVRRAANMAASGASKKEIRAANPGLSSSQVRSAAQSAPKAADPVAIGRITTNSNDPTKNTRTITPTQSPGQTRQSAIKGSDSLGQALKIAASNDAAIGTKEFKNIQKTFGVDASKVVGKLDTLNEKFGSKRGNIGIKGNTANRYARGGFGPTTGIGFGNTGGPLANALAGMNDTYSPMRQGQGGYKTEGYGKAPKGSSIWGFANDSPLYRETTKGTSGWGQFAPSLLPKTVDTTTATTANSSTTGTETTGTEETATELIPDKKPMSPEEMAAASTGDMGDPFAFGGAFSWRSPGKGKKGKGIKSTKAAGGGQAPAPFARTLGM